MTLLSIIKLIILSLSNLFGTWHFSNPCLTSSLSFILGDLHICATCLVSNPCFPSAVLLYLESKFLKNILKPRISGVRILDSIGHSFKDLVWRNFCHFCIFLKSGNLNIYLDKFSVAKRFIGCHFGKMSLFWLTALFWHCGIILALPRFLGFYIIQKIDVENLKKLQLFISLV